MQIYVLHRQEQIGPYDESGIAHAIETGTVSPEALAWVEGRETWTPIRDLLPMIPAKAISSSRPNTSVESSATARSGPSVPKPKSRRWKITIFSIAWLLSLVLIAGCAGWVGFFFGMSSTAAAVSSQAAMISKMAALMPKVRILTLKDDLVAQNVATGNSDGNYMVFVWSLQSPTPERLVVDFLETDSQRVVDTEMVYVQKNAANTTYIEIPTGQKEGMWDVVVRRQ